MQLTVRVAAERTLADSPFGHFLQAVQVFVYRLLHHIALRSQKEVEVIVERFVETSERNVFLPVCLLYERSQGVVGVLVAGIGLFHPIYADPFVKLCIVFPEQGQQRERLLAYAFYGVLYKLCMTYSRSMFVMMLIWNEKDLVKRFADLIEMEATQKNLVNDASVSQKLSGIYPKFDLDKSYTALRMNVKGDFVSVLPVPSLSRNSVWKANRVMYRGY